MDAHAIDGRGYLLEIPDVRAESKGGSAGMLNFEFGEIQFSLAS